MSITAYKVEAVGHDCQATLVLTPLTTPEMTPSS